MHLGMYVNEHSLYDYFACEELQLFLHARIY